MIASYFAIQAEFQLWTSNVEIFLPGWTQTSRRFILSVSGFGHFHQSLSQMKLCHGSSNQCHVPQMCYSIGRVVSKAPKGYNVHELQIPHLIPSHPGSPTPLLVVHMASSHTQMSLWSIITPGQLPITLISKSKDHDSEL